MVCQPSQSVLVLALMKKCYRTHEAYMVSLLSCTWEQLLTRDAPVDAADGVELRGACICSGHSSWILHGVNCIRLPGIKHHSFQPPRRQCGENGGTVATHLKPTPERGGWPAPRSNHFTPWKDLVFSIHEAGWASGPIWMARKKSPPPGFTPWTVEPVASTYTDYAMPCALVQRVAGQFSVLHTTT